MSHVSMLPFAMCLCTELQILVWSDMMYPGCLSSYLLRRHFSSSLFCISTTFRERSYRWVTSIGNCSLALHTSSRFCLWCLDMVLGIRTEFNLKKVPFPIISKGFLGDILHLLTSYFCHFLCIMLVLTIWLVQLCII